MVDSGLPELDETRCTGCGDCVRLCPTNCLELAGPFVWLPRPGDCIRCTFCAIMCPADAIHMEQYGEAD